MRRALVAAARLGVAAAIVLGMFAARVVWSSRVEWDEARDSAHQEAWVDHAGRAARLYVPGNPWSARALASLMSACSPNLEVAANDAAWRLAACREVRSAILATRAVYTPNRDLLAQANERIAVLSAQLEPPSVDPVAPSADLAARTRWHAERLARDQMPSVAWSLVALTGFAAWVGCAIGLLWHGLDERLRLRGRLALGWSAGIAAGFALFLVGLGRA